MRDAATTTSLTERTNTAIGNALAGRKRGAFTPLLFAGPAVIASIAYMDPGNFATNIQAGSKYGYSLLWVVVMANLIAMLFQAACGCSVKWRRWQPIWRSSSAGL